MSNSEIRQKWGGWRTLFGKKPESEKIFEQFLFLMAENLSEFQAANVSFLKIFLYEMKNAWPRNGLPEMKTQKVSFLWVWTESDSLF